MEELIDLEADTEVLWWNETSQSKRRERWQRNKVREIEVIAFTKEGPSAFQVGSFNSGETMDVGTDL